MGMEESGGGGKCFTAAWGMAARSCDSCKSAVALLFCRVDSVFLCMGCDAKIHRLGNARHERVWMCDVCEQAPASVKCKADAAALCVTCDRDIHSANPLSRRHERFPVAPFYDNAESVVKSAAATFLVPADDETTDFPEDKHFINIEVTANSCFTGAETTAPSWVLPNTATKLAAAASDMKSIDLLLSESDQFLDFDYPITDQNPVPDSVVPVQQTVQQLINQSSDNYTEIDFPGSKLNSCSNNNSYTARSLSQSFSSSSMDVGLVPEVSSMSDISYPFRRTSSNTAVAVGGPASTATDRVARVLRYREKRKNRKFEKTIRYASRKAYAETRPRIKGRFAKRAEVEPELVDEMFISGSSAYLAEAVEYGVVPTF